MPTGYTASIENGRITTGKDFLNSCCREFGICMGNNKLPLDEDFLSRFNDDDDNYYTRRLEEAKRTLEKYQSILDEDLQKEIDEKYESNINSANEYIEECNKKNLMYKKVKKEVMDWKPPTSEHENLKKFALDQIDLCYPLEYDYSLEEINRPKNTLSEYRKVAIESACNDIARCNKYIIDEKERIKTRNQWAIDFRNSFR